MPSFEEFSVQVEAFSAQAETFSAQAETFFDTWKPRVEQAAVFVGAAKVLLEAANELIMSDEFRSLLQWCKDYVLRVKNYLISELNKTRDAVRATSPPKLYLANLANMNTLCAVSIYSRLFF